jgi:hypothetical protein
VIWQAVAVSVVLAAASAKTPEGRRIPPSQATHDCGEFEIVFLGKVVETKKDRLPFALIELRNNTCGRYGYAFQLRGSKENGYWLQDDEFLRWETQYPGSHNWEARMGFWHRSLPDDPRKPAFNLKPGESVQVYAEVAEYLHEFPEGTRYRVFITDVFGVDRSSGEFLMPTLKKPTLLPDRQIDIDDSNIVD